MLILPFTWLYDEILLGLLNGAAPAPSLLYILLFTLSDSLLIYTILVALERRFRTAAVLSLLTALYFTIESVVKSSFSMYFTPLSLLSGAGNVAGQYGSELARGFRTGIGRMILFSLPVIAASIIRLVKKKSASGPVQETEHSRGFIERTAFILILSVLVHYGASVAVLHSPYAPVYGAQFNFNEATETLGLTTATRLSFCYEYFANPHDGFSTGKPSEGEPAADEVLQEPSESVSAAPDGAVGEEQGKTDEGALNASETLKEPMITGEAEAAAEETAAEEEPAFNVMDIDFTAEELQDNAASLSAYLASQEPSLKNSYTGIFEGKNLILICAESYCDAFILPELTPTLWRLSHNGIYFSDFYQPSWGGSTTTGELSLIEGLDSNAGVDAVSGIAGNNHYFTMGNQLQRLGYFSLAFHNGSHTFYHRNKSHTHLGYDAYFACGQHLDFFCGHNYPTDTEMFEGTLPAYIGHEPFSVYYMTVSGHAPYEKSSPLVKKYYDTVNEICGDAFYEKTKYYICYQMELENALTSMVNMLEEAGIADDTVIVMTGDHYPYGLGSGKTWKNDRDYIDDLIKADDALYWNEDKSGLIIWSGALEGELKPYVCEVSEPVSSLDILPTVSNLFGLEFDSRLLPGRDVFAENTDPLVFWNNRSWITEEGKYDTRKRVFYPDEEGTRAELTPEQLAEINALVEDKILMCGQIMKLDYYGLAFGPDESEDRQEEIWTLLQQEAAERGHYEKTEDTSGTDHGA